MCRIIASLGAFYLVTQLCLAQTPEELTHTYLDLVKQEKWKEATALMAPDALKKFRSLTAFDQDAPTEHSERLLKLILGPDVTAQSLKDMSDADYFAAFASSSMRSAVDRGMQIQSIRFIGSVPEGEKTQHILIRLHFKYHEVEMERLEICTCVLTDDGWKLDLNNNWNGMAHQFKTVIAR